MVHRRCEISFPNLFSGQLVTSWIASAHQVTTGAADGTSFLLSLAHSPSFELCDRSQDSEREPPHNVVGRQVGKISEDYDDAGVYKFQQKSGITGEPVQLRDN